MTIPLALVAGFLGAGKTTFLTRYAARIAPRRVAFLVNEFAATDVDTPLLAAAAPCVVGISGGSIFCRCKATEFIRQLSGLAEEFPGLDGVVVEASGMADPSAARSMLDEAGLDRIYSMVGTVTLVDPGTLRKILDTLPAAERQVAAADLVVMSKADLHPPEVLAACADLVRTINPAAQLLQVVRGACAIDLLALGSQRWVDGVVAECADPALLPVELPLDRMMAATDLAAAIAALGDDLHRAKGFIPTHDGWVYLDWSAGRLALTPAASGRAGLALIIHPRARERTAALVAAVAAGTFAS